MTGNAAIETVYWADDPTRTREVVGYCKVCCPDEAARRTIYLVSPSGLAHHSDAYGRTDCGHDATGADWWWRS